MSLELSFSLCQSCSCSSLTFFEKTGEYNATNNLTGWGSPNPETTDATSAILTVVNNAGTFNIDLKTISIDQFPTEITTWGFEIPNEQFGYTTGNKIPDQIMTFTYTVTVIIDNVTTVYSQTIYQAFTCNTKCCVDKMLLKIDFCNCNCDNKPFNNWLQALALFYGLQASADKGNIIKFNNDLTQLNKLCGGSCGCGC